METKAKQLPSKNTDQYYVTLNKAKKIRDSRKAQLIGQINTGKLPVYLETWANRILQLEYLIIDLRK